MHKKIIGLFAIGVLTLSVTPATSEAQLRSDSTSIKDTPVDHGVTQIVTDRLREESEEALSRSFLKHTYRLNGLDDLSTGSIIAKKQLKALFLERLAGQVSTDMDGKQALRDASELRALLAIGAKILVTGEELAGGTLSLTATAITTPEFSAEAVSVLRKNRRVVQEILDVKELASQSLEEIAELQMKAAQSSDRTGLTESYRAAVNRLAATAWYEAARYSELRGDIQASIDAYSEAIKAHPGMAAAYRNRGRHYVKYVMDESKAIADFGRAIQSYNSDAADHFELKEYDKCLEDTRAALALNKTYGGSHFQQAMCRVGLGQQKEAMKDFVKAAQLGDGGAQDLLSRKGISW